MDSLHAGWALEILLIMLLSEQNHQSAQRQWTDEKVESDRSLGSCQAHGLGRRGYSKSKEMWGYSKDGSPGALRKWNRRQCLDHKRFPLFLGFPCSPVRLHCVGWSDSSPILPETVFLSLIELLTVKGYIGMFIKLYTYFKVQSLVSLSGSEIILVLNWQALVYYLSQFRRIHLN